MPSTPPQDDPPAPDAPESPLKDPRSTAGGAGGQPPSKDDDKPEKQASPLKKGITRVVLIVILIIALIAAALWFHKYWTHGRFIQSTNDAYIQADQVNVATRVAGFVDQVFVRDNQPIKAGDPLVKIDERDPRARLEQALAQVDQGKASIIQDQAQIRQQQAQILQAQAQLAGSRSQLSFAEKQAARYAPLAATGAETSEHYDQMQQNSDQAHAQVAGNAAQVLSAQRQIATLQAQVLTGQAQIEQARAQVRQAQVDLDATLVRASIDGRIGDKTVRLGQYVQPGLRLMSVVPVEGVYITANFKETQIGLMRVGQPVSIKIDALKGEILHGEVESFSPGTGAQFALIPANNATGNFTKIVQRLPVRIHIDAGPEARKVLVPGLSASVSVDTLGAKTDVQGVKAEVHKTKDERQAQTRQELDQDRQDHNLGAGR
ncbi:MAG: HlyD family secretion protein [Caulobacteraceae bacterium]